MKALRVLTYHIRCGSEEISFFEGDIDKDRQHWHNQDNVTVRYFELKEIK